MAHFPKPFFKKSRGVWYVEINRRQFNLGPDQEEAFQQYLAMMAQPRETKVSTTKLAAIADAFLEWTTNRRSAATFEWYRYRLERLVRKYPDLPAEDIKPYHIENWVADYDFSITSQRNYMRAAKRCLKWAVRQGYLEKNPLEHLEIPSGERKEVALTEDEYQHMLTFVRNEPLKELIQVTWETGCRPQESLIVAARHVDLENERWVFRQSEAKMKRMTRVVYMTDSAMNIIRRRVAKFPEGPIFRNTSGKPWSADSVNSAFEAIRNRMGKHRMEQEGFTIGDYDIDSLIPTLSPTKNVKGDPIAKSRSELRCEARRKLAHRKANELVPRYSLYALRHSWATNALRRGVDPLTVAILMGHSDPSMLSKVYQHLALDPEHMRQQARKAAG